MNLKWCHNVKEFDGNFQEFSNIFWTDFSNIEGILGRIGGGRQSLVSLETLEAIKDIWITAKFGNINDFVAKY